VDILHRYVYIYIYIYMHIYIYKLSRKMDTTIPLALTAHHTPNLTSCNGTSRTNIGLCADHFLPDIQSVHVPTEAKRTFVTELSECAVYLPSVHRIKASCRNCIQYIYHIQNSRLVMCCSLGLMTARVYSHDLDDNANVIWSDFCMTGKQPGSDKSYLSDETRSLYTPAYVQQHILLIQLKSFDLIKVYTVGTSNEI
jgi:hypothetical protein